MSYQTSASGMCTQPEDCRALINEVRSQPDDPEFGNAFRDACRKTAFVIVQRAQRDFTVIPVGSRVAKTYRLIDTIPAIAN